MYCVVCMHLYARWLYCNPVWDSYYLRSKKVGGLFGVFYGELGPRMQHAEYVLYPVIVMLLVRYTEEWMRKMGCLMIIRQLSLS